MSPIISVFFFLSFRPSPVIFFSDPDSDWILGPDGSPMKKQEDSIEQATVIIRDEFAGSTKEETFQAWVLFFTLPFTSSCDCFFLIVFLLRFSSSRITGFS